MPGQIVFAAGMDAAITPQFTVTFDFLDQTVINGQRSFLSAHVAADGTNYMTPVYPNQMRHESSVAAGFKASLLRQSGGAIGGRDLFLTGNIQFRTNQAGLRARAVPLFGLSYTFGGAVAAPRAVEKRDPR